MWNILDARLTLCTTLWFRAVLCKSTAELYYELHLISLRYITYTSQLVCIQILFIFLLF